MSVHFSYGVRRMIYGRFLPTMICLFSVMAIGCDPDDNQEGQVVIDGGAHGSYDAVQEGTDTGVTRGDIDSSVGSSPDTGGGTTRDGSLIAFDAGEMPRVDMDLPSSDIGVGSKRCEPEPLENHLYTMSALSLTRQEEVSMCDFQGQALLIVNTAANCGFTPQYQQLETLNRAYRGRPLVILGFLTNDFQNQGGSLEEVERCTEEYMIHFEQFYHVGVTPNSRDTLHPIFEWLTTQAGQEGEVPWNFSKFLVSHDGQLLQRWDHFTTPDNPNFLMAVEAAVLAAPFTP